MKIGVLSLVFIAMVSGGCSAVKPWEREYLADEIMQFDPDPLKAEWDLHVQEVLEGAHGGFNGSGGGCGCR